MMGILCGILYILQIESLPPKSSRDTRVRLPLYRIWPTSDTSRSQCCRRRRGLDWTWCPKSYVREDMSRTLLINLYVIFIHLNLYCYTNHWILALINVEWQTTRPTDNSAQAELSRDNSAPVWNNSAPMAARWIIFIGEIERRIHIVCEEYHNGGYRYWLIQ